MLPKLKTVRVELSTPQGSVFSGNAGDVVMRTSEGAITIAPRDENYLNLTRTTEITLRVGTEFIRFLLKNAAASLRDGRLTVLAEEIHGVELSACGPVTDN